MLSIKEVRTALGEKGKLLTDEQVTELRREFYKLAQLDLELFKERELKANKYGMGTEIPGVRGNQD